jgi:hypothetical protein
MFKASSWLGNKQALNHLISLKVLNKNEYFEIRPAAQDQVLSDETKKELKDTLERASPIKSQKSDRPQFSDQQQYDQAAPIEQEEILSAPDFPKQSSWNKSSARRDKGTVFN